MKADFCLYFLTLGCPDDISGWYDVRTIQNCIEQASNDGYTTLIEARLITGNERKLMKWPPYCGTNWTDKTFYSQNGGTDQSATLENTIILKAI